MSLSAFAKRLGKSNGFITQVKHAAEVHREIFSQLKNFDTTGRSQHLFEIHAAPESTWILLATLLQDSGSSKDTKSWSAKDTKAAVDRIRSVSDLVPSWLPDVSSVYPKVAMEPGFAKSTAAAGKDGSAAETEAKRKGCAGEVIQHFMNEQSRIVAILPRLHARAGDPGRAIWHRCQIAPTPRARG